MAMFAHLAPESRIALIRHNGIRRLRQAVGDFPGGVFAVPETDYIRVWYSSTNRR
jgi:hypothetical protein